MSRKNGDLFMIGLNLLFLAAIIVLFARLTAEFRQPNPDEGIGTRQAALLQTYATSERMLLYIDTAASFAAYEAVDVLLREGAMSAADPACGTYASYLRWSAPGKQCFPQRKEIDARFGKRMLASLDGMLRRYPGMPAISGYDVQVAQQGDDLVVRALAQGKISLPIAAAKNAEQRRAEEATMGQGAALAQQGTFTKDTALDARVVPSGNRDAREGKVVGIVVLSAHEAQAADALDKYLRGDTSPHYLIGKDGALFQLVPEGQRALFCDGCDEEEREVVSVALLNAGEIEPEAETGRCPGTQAGDDCWEAFGKPQVDALARLAADIALRADLAPERVTLAQEEDIAPGPAFPALAQLVSDVAARKGELALAQGERRGDPAAGVAASSSAVVLPSIRWPAQDRTLTSCWGSRYVNGKFDPMHDGVDVAGDPSKPVLAAMDGTVKQVCAAPCAGFGNSVLIDHDDIAPGMLTRYSHMDRFAKGLKEGSFVKAGDQLGFIGNTGHSTANHLDFKIFVNGDTASDHGKNPLCFFPESELRTLKIGPSAQSCRKYTANGLPGLTQSNPALAKECAGIAQLSSDEGCFSGSSSVRTDIGGDARLTRTLARLEQAGLVEAIEQAAQEEEIDPRLIIAIIATESQGEADILNKYGAVGIGQVKTAAAKDLAALGIFSREANVGCVCRGKDVCYAREVAACTGDPRLDARASIRGIARYLAIQESYLAGEGQRDLSDIDTFMIASYNQGAGTIAKAIAKAKARGARDPSWDAVAPFVNGEGQNYVKTVMGHFTAQGGTTASAFSDQVCGGAGAGFEDVTIKDMGQYSFAPSFSVRMHDLLSPVVTLSDWAKATYEACDGRADNRECLARSKAQFRDARIEIVSCADVEGNALVATRLEQAVQDCKDNGQDGCLCGYDPNRPTGDVEVRLYGSRAQVFIEGENVTEAPSGDAVVQFALRPEEEPFQATISLESRDGEKRMVLWEAEEVDEGTVEPFASREDEHEVERFWMHKKGKDVVWVADPGDAQACGVYKTQHHVCARLASPTYTIADGKSEQPELRFAISLRDDHPPLPVSGARAQEQADATDAINPIDDITDAVLGTRIAVSFEPSQSEDASYYMVACPAAPGAREAARVRVLGREFDGLGRDARIASRLTARVTCEGVLTAGVVTITPYDISGRQGQAVSAVIETQGS